MEFSFEAPHCGRGSLLLAHQKELELEKRENKLNQKIQGVVKQEIAAKDRAFNDMKEIEDRSIKLAEASRKKSGNWEITGLLGAAALVIGFLLAK